ncbi:MAG: methylated-DNA--[protein]-cysteine S-methyltransferase [Deltaproteobacteria bacterium]|nr:methylated-DNA--[protein]-cysteine S-methyltransferase [Deltaproteobacteria bacterium]
MKKRWHYDFPIGKLWIVEEEHAIIHIGFAGEDRSLAGYDNAETPLIKETGRQLSEYFSGSRKDFTVPLLLKGTVFQQSVWQALREIPYGETRSYKEIAVGVGNPKACRAVGMANNRNPIAIVVPCHRVVGYDGSLTGYAGGLPIKQYLLDLEKSNLQRNYFFYGEKEIEHLKSRDPILGEAIDRIGKINREITSDIFAALVKSIVGQQISTKAQTSIWNRMRNGIRPMDPQSINQLCVQELRAFGISGRKALYIKDMAEQILNGRVDLPALAAMPEEEVCETLVRLKGVGVWTAEMIMLFSMQRPDILSWGDFGIHRGLRMLYGHRKITPRLFSRYKQLYSPYASTASLYLWAIAGGACSELTDRASTKADNARI